MTIYIVKFERMGIVTLTPNYLEKSYTKIIGNNSNINIKFILGKK